MFLERDRISSNNELVLKSWSLKAKLLYFFLDIGKVEKIPLVIKDIIGNKIIANPISQREEVNEYLTNSNRS